MLSKRKLDRLKMSGKVDFGGKNITRDKEGHFIMIKGQINQGSIKKLNIYKSNNRASKYIYI